MSERNLRVTHVEGYEVRVPAHAGRVNSDEFGPPIWDQTPKIVFEVHTESGMVGLGESPRGVGEASLRAAVAQLAKHNLLEMCFQEPALVDLSADDLFGHHNPKRPHRLLERNFNSYDQIGIHAALLDLVGKHLGVSVAMLLGGAYRTRVSVDSWMGRMTPEASARVCLDAKQRGYHGCKMKCALEDDNVDRAQAICDACGSDFKLTFDPNSRFYRFGEAMGMLRRLAAVGNIGCVEDPFNKSNLDDYRLLREQGLMPVALHLGYDGTLVEAIRARARACDFVNLSATPFDVKKAGDLCWICGVPTWHGSGVDLGILEALFLHVAAATKSMSRPSDIFGRTIRQHNLIRNEFLPADGAIDVPMGDGLGVELDRDALDRFALRKFRIELGR